MEVVYVLQHLHTLPNGEGDVKLIGVYRSLESALAAIERLGRQPGFSDHPRLWDSEADDDEQGFHIAKYPLDKDHWPEGYVKGPTANIAARGESDGWPAASNRNIRGSDE